MPRKRNLRMETYNKLISIGKSTEKDISNLKIEDLNDSIITILNDLAPIMFISVYSIL